MVKQLLRFLWDSPRNLAIGVIHAYQMTLSPDHGPLKGLHPYGFCRHEPTCSQYSKRAMREHGFVIGSLLLVKRLLSCHPWKKPDEAKVRKMLGV